MQENKRFFQRSFCIFQGINTVYQKKFQLRKGFEGFENKSVKLTTFKALQYNITRSLDINSSNRMFSSIHDFLSKTRSLNL